MASSAPPRDGSSMTSQSEIDGDRNESHQHHAGGGEKRARGAIACDICRNRKLKCDGNRPCRRCAHDPTGCTYSILPRRSALTRARMTELEDRLDLHEIIWNVAFPDVPLREAEDLALSDRTMRTLQAKLSAASSSPSLLSGLNKPGQDDHGLGLSAQAQSASKLGGGGGMNGHVAGHGTFSLNQTETTLGSIPERVASSMDRGLYSHETSSRTTPRPSPPLPFDMPSSGIPENITTAGHPMMIPSNVNTIPGASTSASAMAAASSSRIPPYARADEPVDLEWQEEQNRTTGQPRLDGMVSLAREDSGTSYLGLSSGATFLHAIRRLYEDAHPGVLPDIFTIQTGNTPETRTSVDGTADEARLEVVPARPKSGRKSEPVVLPPLIETMPLVESYFRYFHTLTPIVHEPTIRAQILGAVPTNKKQGSEVLLYMIFAMGSFDIANREVNDDGWRYYEKAKEALAKELFAKGTLQLVQGVAIMSNYLQRNNRPNAGYLCLGLALRMAIALGLHVSGDESKMTLLEAQTRRRVWWTLAALEAGCSITFGRPFGLGRLRTTSCLLPFNCSDEQITVSTFEAPMESPSPTIYSALIVQARLACVMSDIHSSILQANPAPTYEQIKRYDARVLALLQSTPDYMKDMDSPSPWFFARAVTTWRIRDFRAILYRPILLTAAWDSIRRNEMPCGNREAINICRSLAIENLTDIGQFALLDDPMVGSRGAQWYLLFFAFQSTLTLLLSVVWEPEDPSADYWKQLLFSTSAWFRRCTSIQSLGDSFANIIESILHNHNQTPQDLSAFLPADISSSFPVAFPSGYLGVSANPVSIENWSDWFQAFGNDPSMADPNHGLDMAFAAGEWQL